MKRRNRQNPFSLFAFQDIITGLCGIMIFLVLLQVIDIAMDRTGAAISEPDEGLFDDRRAELRSEIAALERKNAQLRAKTAKVIIVPEDRVDPSKRDKLAKEMSEKELAVAALVSQVRDLETLVEKARKTDAEDRERIKEMERTKRLLEQQIADFSNRKGITLIPERGEYKIPMFIVCSWKGLEVYRPFEKNKPMTLITRPGIEVKFAALLSDLDRTTHSAVLLVRPTGAAVMDIAVAQLKRHNIAYGRDPLEEDVEIVFKEPEGK